MDVKRIGVREAHNLIQEDGYSLVDVRSMPEYEEGHPAGSFNVPFLHKTPNGMLPNPDFARVVQFLFPDKSQKLLVSCQAGGRSHRATQELMSLGYTNVLDVQGGYGGERDDDRLVHPGWVDEQLPSEAGEPDGRAYRFIAERLNANEETDADAEDEAPQTPAAPPPPTAQADDGLNRFASGSHRVMCIRYARELPGLKRRPYPGTLGERVYGEVSALAWNDWVEHSKMIINEYRINASDPSALKVLMEQCEQFFYGSGVARPEGFVPE
ncbi:MAG: oxidative damage protection protein [Myxococcales bacterium]|nr:oxidative damage protection protein [Myxococcales bacterium]